MLTPEPALETLLRSPNLWRGDSRAAVTVSSVATGHTELDALLPGGGWPRAAITEFLIARPGIGEFSLLMPALAKLSQAEEWIALVSPPYLPYAPALAAAGVDLSRLVVIRTGTTTSRNEDHGAETLWAMEQALTSGSCSAVIGWPTFLNERSLRRLQLAAENGKAIGMYFSSGHATSSSLAALRLQLTPVQEKLHIHVLKVRGSGIGATLTIDSRHPENNNTADAHRFFHASSQRHVQENSAPATTPAYAAPTSQAPLSPSSRWRNGTNRAEAE